MAGPGRQGVFLEEVLKDGQEAQGGGGRWGRAFYTGGRMLQREEHRVLEELKEATESSWIIMATEGGLTCGVEAVDDPGPCGPQSVMQAAHMG